MVLAQAEERDVFYNNHFVVRLSRYDMKDFARIVMQSGANLIVHKRDARVVPFRPGRLGFSPMPSSINRTHRFIFSRRLTFRLLFCCATVLRVCPSLPGSAPDLFAAVRRSSLPADPQAAARPLRSQSRTIIISFEVGLAMPRALPLSAPARMSLDGLIGVQARLLASCVRTRAMSPTSTFCYRFNRSDSLNRQQLRRDFFI